MAILLVASTSKAQDVPLHAVYETQIASTRGKPQCRRWAFTRRALDVDYRDFDRGISERWSHDARGNPSVVRVYHNERTAVRYTPGDLAAYQITPEWSKLLHVLEPPATATRGSKKQILGRAAHRYTFTQATQHLEVLWFAELAIPGEIRIREAGRPSIVVRLIELSIESPAPFDLRLRQIDFTDFGDMESDPFVQNHHDDPLPAPLPTLVLQLRR